MKFCQPHWDMCREAIKDRGMDGLIAKSSEAAMENELKALDGQQPDFDPLMSMHWYFTNNALRSGGLYLMCSNEDGSNEGHYCPLCEFEKHSEGFVAKDVISNVADQMRENCITTGLIARPS